jgi:hypothetical protein
MSEMSMGSLQGIRAMISSKEKQANIFFPQKLVSLTFLQHLKNQAFN